VTVALAPRDPLTAPAPRERAAEIDDVTLRRAQRGDPVACRAVVERYQAPVFALLGRLLGSGRRATIEDLAQDTFLAVFRQLAGFSPLGPARLSTWILTIASRRAVDELRRRPAPALTAAEVAGGDRADDAVTRRRLAAAIDRALAGLAPEFRAAFVLYELHGLDYAEIARALDIDPGTVKSRLSRARARLRIALAEVHRD